MSDHTTRPNPQEIPYGYCHCGCGQKTNLAPGTDRRRGWIKGEPLRYILGHQHRRYGNEVEAANPSGLCMCGCGQPTRIAPVTDRKRGWIRGQPLKYINGHQNRKPLEPIPEYCACGCGQRLRKSKHPSHQPRYITGHNNRQPIEDRFWARVDKCGSNGCWNWMAGAGSHGYGELSVDGKPVTVHRLVWALVHGPIPKDLHVLHRCDNKRCVNPAHLFLGTNIDNILDKVAKGRQHHSGGSKGETNARARFVESQIVEIRRRAAQGEPQRKLAKEFGVTQGYISNVIRRKIWKHI